MGDAMIARMAEGDDRQGSLYFAHFDFLEEYKGHGFSDAFCAIMKAANEIGARYVRFCADADELDGFPTFDW